MAEQSMVAASQSVVVRSVQVNWEQWERMVSVLRQFGADRNGFHAYQKAVAGAVNRTLITGRARLARRIQEHLMLKISDIKDRINLKKSSWKGTGGTISVSRKQIPLIDYLSAGRQPKQQPKGGIRVQVRRDGPPDVFPESFLMAMKTGHIGVFRRAWDRDKGGRVGKDKRARHLPIVERQGPSVVGALANAPGNGGTILDEVVDELGVVLQKNLESKVDYWMSGRAAPPDETE